MSDIPPNASEKLPPPARPPKTGVLFLSELQSDPIQDRAPNWAYLGIFFHVGE
jgi:hypothetical protein